MTLKLTDRQMGILRHSLGITINNRSCFRNRYVAAADVIDELVELVSIGMMLRDETDEESGGWPVYRATEEGKKIALDVSDQLVEIAGLVQTQGNRATSDPLFAVRQVRRIYGVDPAYHDSGHEWVMPDDTETRVADEMAARLDELKKKYEWDLTDAEKDEMVGFECVHFVDIPEFVTACFTERGCQRYIDSNGHNHTGKLEIYAYSGFRNYEWIDIRTHFMNMEVPDEH